MLCCTRGDAVEVHERSDGEAHQGTIEELAQKEREIQTPGDKKETPGQQHQARQQGMKQNTAQERGEGGRGRGRREGRKMEKKGN